MKKNPIAAFLVALVFLGALAVAGLSYAYVHSVRELRDLQGQTAVISRNRTMFQNLANDAVAYSEINPAIRPLLAEVGIRIESGQVPPNPNDDPK